jgi:DNA-directed RNA polymerase subunit RPC12/RpoP
MCAKCQHIFASDAEEIICPECNYQGKVAGVMKVTGVPSLSVFKRNYGKANFPKQSEK